MFHWLSIGAADSIQCDVCMLGPIDRHIRVICSDALFEGRQFPGGNLIAVRQYARLRSREALQRFAEQAARKYMSKSKWLGRAQQRQIEIAPGPAMLEGIVENEQIDSGIA